MKNRAELLEERLAREPARMVPNRLTIPLIPFDFAERSRQAGAVPLAEKYARLPFHYRVERAPFAVRDDGCSTRHRLDDRDPEIFDARNDQTPRPAENFPDLLR